MLNHTCFTTQLWFLCPRAARRGIWKDGLNAETPAEYKRRYAMSPNQANVASNADTNSSPITTKPRQRSKKSNWWTRLLSSWTFCFITRWLRDILRIKIKLLLAERMTCNCAITCFPSICWLTWAFLSLGLFKLMMLYTFDCDAYLNFAPSVVL